MKRRYLIVLLILFIVFISVKAETINNQCDSLITFKEQSSLDESIYICKDKDYKSGNGSIQYLASEKKVIFNNLNAYYLEILNDDYVFEIKGDNTISLLNINNNKIKIIGDGKIKFKEASFTKKVENGEYVYNYKYQDKFIIDLDDGYFEGTQKKFEENYTDLIEKNSLNDDFVLEDYELVPVIDCTKINSLAITNSWLDEYIDTVLSKKLSDGYGVIEKVKEDNKSDKSKEEVKLEAGNVILITDKKVNSKYKLKVKNLKKNDVSSKVSKKLKEDEKLVSFYDLNVYNGKKVVEMKNGSYLIKIKLDEIDEEYDNYKIIYVNDSGEIEEYLDGELDGQYVVFNTSHLSQYGVVASKKELKEEPILNVSNNKKSSFNNVLKIVILGIITLLFVVLILFVNIKGKKVINIKEKRSVR